MAGPAATPATRAGPEVSSSDGTPALAARPIRSAYALSGTPGGRLPDSTTAELCATASA